MPKFDPTKTSIKEGYEFVSASGTLEVEQRLIKIPDALFSFQDYVGLFTRKDGAANLANVERDLAVLNGCEVEVRIKILKFPVQSIVKEGSAKQ
jgi:hypothetical protein